jgi:flagellar P-ring protein FlgI
MKKIILAISVFFLLLNTVYTDSDFKVRIKDIGKIIEARDNQLLGFGLVVGLRNTGDSKNIIFTNKALTKLLENMDILKDDKEFSSRNVAGVMVTANLPPYVKKGQKISVIVSSIGDSKSLEGGTLLLTPLKGPDLNTYALAQGPVVVGGVLGQSSRTSYTKNQTTVGRIPAGAIVEKEVPVTQQDQHNLTIVLNEPNFITVSRTADALNDAGFNGSKAVDANMIKIPLKEINTEYLVATIAQIENVEVVPDTTSKIIVNARTGTVVIGDKVRLLPTALTHGNISLKISDSIGIEADVSSEMTEVKVNETETKVIYLKPEASLSSLVKSLNEIGATPRDLISIIQALKESGSLIGQVIIL